MFGTSQDHSQDPIQIKQDDKFFLRLLSKESSMTNPSFRVYYEGGAGAVPFMWESQPGTPKCSFNETTLPPLTPPPSYYFNSDKNPVNNKKYSRSNLLHILFPKMNMLKKSDGVPSSPSSSSLSSNSPSRSSSNFSMVVPITSPKKYHHRARSRFSSRGSLFDSRADYEDAEAVGSSPTSTLWLSRIKGCYGW